MLGRSILQRLEFRRQIATIGKVEVPEGARKEAELQYHFRTDGIIEKHNIPKSLVRNSYQTPSKYVTVGRTTMAPSKFVTVGRTRMAPSKYITVGRTTMAPSKYVTVGCTTMTPKNLTRVGLAFSTEEVAIPNTSMRREKIQEMQINADY